MRNSGFHYKGISNVTINRNLEIETGADSIVISFSPRSREEDVRWTVKRDSTAILSKLAGTIQIDPAGNIILKIHKISC